MRESQTSTADEAWLATGIAVDDLWEGEMRGVPVGDDDVLVVNADGALRAFDDRCPHAATLLSEGSFEGNVITCRAHLWEFDALSGKGINPDDCSLVEFPVKVVDGAVFVRLIS